MVENNMLDNLKKYNVVLASNSPRRKELLAGLELPFEVRTLKGIDESYPADLKGEDIPKHIATKKAQAYLATMKDDELLITADTIVYIDGQVLGKPEDREDAIRMLKQLSGRTHEVITGVSISTQQQTKTFATTSKVSFANLSDADIEHYVDNYRPFDKAGAYGIQEWIGYIGVNGLEGSYFNVMGLPIQRLYEELCTII